MLGNLIHEPLVNIYTCVFFTCLMWKLSNGQCVENVIDNAINKYVYESGFIV